MITSEKILETGELIDSQYELSISFKNYHNQFKTEVQYFIMFLRNRQRIELQNIESILEIIHFHEKLEQETINYISEEAFKHYKLCIKAFDYGMVPEEILKKHNYNTEEANQDYFSINSPMEAFEKLKLTHVLISEFENEHGELSYLSTFEFRIPWENEHGIKFHYKNMELVSAE